MGCGCLLLVLGMAFPRFTILMLWIFTHWFRGMFDTWLIPVLGFLLLPYTFLWYSVVLHLFGGAWGFWPVLILIVAVLADLTSYGGARRKR